MQVEVVKAVPEPIFLSALFRMSMKNLMLDDVGFFQRSLMACVASFLYSLMSWPRVGLSAHVSS